MSRRLSDAEHAVQYDQIQLRFNSEAFADAISMAVELFENPTTKEFSTRDFLLALSFSMPDLLDRAGAEWAGADPDEWMIENLIEGHSRGFHVPSADGAEGLSLLCPKCQQSTVNGDTE